jgi:hypothetical protein
VAEQTTFRHGLVLSGALWSVARRERARAPCAALGPLRGHGIRLSMCRRRPVGNGRRKCRTRRGHRKNWKHRGGPSALLALGELAQRRWQLLDWHRSTQRRPLAGRKHDMDSGGGATRCRCHISLEPCGYPVRPKLVKPIATEPLPHAVRLLPWFTPSVSLYRPIPAYPQPNQLTGTVRRGLTSLAPQVAAPLP